MSSPLSWGPWRRWPPCPTFTTEDAAKIVAADLRRSGLRESRVLAVAGQYRVETRERHGATSRGEAR
jgi:hypothetical protein